jgi:hypothetical protein
MRPEALQRVICGRDIFHVDAHEVVEFFRLCHQLANQGESNAPCQAATHLGRLDGQIAVELFALDGAQNFQGLIFESHRLVESVMNSPRISMVVIIPC